MKVTYSFKGTLGPAEEPEFHENKKNHFFYNPHSSFFIEMEFAQIEVFNRLAWLTDTEKKISKDGEISIEHKKLPPEKEEETYDRIAALIESSNKIINITEDIDFYVNKKMFPWDEDYETVECTTLYMLVNSIDTKSRALEGAAEQYFHQDWEFSRAGEIKMLYPKHFSKFLGLDYKVIDSPFVVEKKEVISVAEHNRRRATWLEYDASSEDDEYITKPNPERMQKAIEKKNN